MSVFNQVADGLKRLLPGSARPVPAARSVHYNCVCDEEVSLRCANDSCARRIDPGSNMMVAPDGSVLCSENCAVAFAGALG
ncbi:MAG TPA: hypothetical protein VHJ82_00975 [Actinomycetota bacterium]|nr:hypothetical protein [Actinomycetota bacterium]